MSEKVLRILLSELKVIRIRCGQPSCGAVTELPLPAVITANPKTCPICGYSLIAFTGSGPKPPSLADLARIIEGLNAAKNGTDIEFVLTDPS